MSLGREEFAEFFGELHDGHRPFAWQERLLDEVLHAGRWPSCVVAPTGAGKTAIIDVHVFALALAAAGKGPMLPRRLAMVVDRRVLVDDQYSYAQTLARRLLAPSTGDEVPVLARIRELLWTARSPDPERRAQESPDEVSPLVVGRLRGGAPPSLTWRDHPTAAAVICATPDMWGSRLLFRGYGSSSLAWPREAGLLAVDSVVVVDEAHLARQLLCTARRVAELAQVAERGFVGRALQVVETTATPAASANTGGVRTTVGVEVVDLDDELLSRRLTRPKPLTLRPAKDWDSTKPTAKVTSVLADAVVELLGAQQAEVGPGDATRTVGCFVNTVVRAVAVAQELRRREIGGRPIRVVMVCGQVRPVDVDRLAEKHPGLLGPAGNPDVDVLVSTQSLEVGVDLDLAALVTELASGSALAQRAGRVNRRGLRADGRIVVVVPDGAAPDGDSSAAPIPDRARSGPYGAPELRAALTWLVGRATEPAGLAPWQVRADPPPAASARRTLYQRPELAQAWHWARTSDHLAAEPELDLWLAEDFAQDTSVGFVVRDDLPADPTDARTLIRELPPRRHEVFSVPFRTARAVLGAARAETGLAAVRVRGEDIEPLGWRVAQDRGAGEQPRLRPGDIVVLDSAVELFTASDAGFSPPVVVPIDVEGAPPNRWGADDVLEAQAELPAEIWAGRRVGGVVRRIELGRAPEQPHLAALVSTLRGANGPPSPEEERQAVRECLADDPTPTPMAAAAAELLASSPLRTEVVIQYVDDEPVRVLVIDRRRAGADEGLRQVWTPKGLEVTLEAHQQAVADRAAMLAGHLGLEQQLVDALALAGAHHDDGKRDLRFQRRLGASGGILLAKSRAGTTAQQARHNDRLSGLPGGWRHEQLSVVECWEPIQSSGDPELVARLVGTSHGYGRSGFPHAAHELLQPAGPVAQQLFQLGGWDDLIEATQLRYGVWGCAFMEAVLRAADGQVSQEGR